MTSWRRRNVTGGSQSSLDRPPTSLSRWTSARLHESDGTAVAAGEGAGGAEAGVEAGEGAARAAHATPGMTLGETSEFPTAAGARGGAHHLAASIRRARSASSWQNQAHRLHCIASITIASACSARPSRLGHRALRNREPNFDAPCLLPRCRLRKEQPSPLRSRRRSRSRAGLSCRTDSPRCVPPLPRPR